MKETKIK